MADIERCAKCSGHIDGAHLDAGGDPLCNGCAASWMEGERDAACDRLRGAVRRAEHLQRAIIAIDEAICHDNVSEAKRIARAAFGGLA